MGLEGGPYGCYDSYNVSVAGLPNGAVTIINLAEGGNVVSIDATAIPAFVLNGMSGPYEFSISDPDNANNTCWGTFMLEDKIKPTITCDTITVSCVTGTEPGESTFGVSSGSMEASDALAWSDGTTGAVGSISLATSGAPAGSVATSIKVTIGMDHSWVGDVDLNLEGPNGAVVNIIDSQCSINDNVNATFYDDAPAPISCAAGATGGPHENCPGQYTQFATISQDVQPNGSFADFLGGSTNGTWTLYATDAVGGDGGCISEFSVTVEWAVYAASLPLVDDNCGTLPLTYEDVVVDGDCTSEFAQTVYRTWSVDDAKGNGPVSCTQVINVTREDLSSLVVPANWDGLPGSQPILACDGNWPALADGNPSPAYTGYPGGVGTCGTISWTYQDIELPICTTSATCIDCSDIVSYKVLRNWIIVDWCTGQVLEHPQIIKVMDLVAPTFDTPQADVTISTDIWGCAATLNLADLDYVVSDNCSAFKVTYSTSGGTLVGPACNPTSIVFADPANCKAPVQVVMTAEDCCGNKSTDSFLVTIEDNVPPVVVADEHTVVTLSTDGTAKIFATTFDDGSHDGCGPIGMSARRMDNTDGCNFVDLYDGVLGNGQGANLKDDNFEFNEIVHFCCADVGTPVMVIFRVCDDGDCNGIIGSGGDNCNTAMVEVEVQDKLAPTIVCPPNVTINCIDYAALGDLNSLSDAELNAMWGEATAYSTCGGTPDQVLSGTEVCGSGVVNRIFTVTTAGGSATCIQKIFVEQDVNGDNFLECEDITFPSAPESQYNWCLSASNGGPIQSFNPITLNSGDCGGFNPQTPSINIDDLCTEVGINVTIDTFAFAGGGCFKYLVHWEVIDQCLFDENYVDPNTGETNPFDTDNGYFHIYVEYDVFDNEGPTVDCTEDVIIGCNDDFYAGPIVGSASDNCTDAAYFGWNWKLDAGNDFIIDAQGQGQSIPGPFPVGTHRVIWVVSDGCGNTTTEACVFTIEKEDSKAPTPYCYDGLSTAIMQPPACSVTLWAEDFNAGSFDDCGAIDFVSIVPEVDVEGLSADEAYEASLNLINGVYGWTFDCSYIENGVTAVIEIRMYATDGAGNYDYCVASLRLDDNFDCCEDQGGSKAIGGAVNTEAGEPVSGATVEADAAHSEYPQYQVTEDDGAYAFYNAPQYYDFDITSAKDENYLNGVTTLDLVLIQKHILSIQTLDSPYKLIAADINSDCNVTANDLLELRKLILGLYANDDLPNNQSWRFVDGAYQFQNPTQPCPFDEVIDVDNLIVNQMSENFVGVKVGDVNGSAIANATMDAETRNANAITLTVNEAVVNAGEEFSLEFTSADFSDVSGYQFTLGFDNSVAEFAGIEAGALNISEANFGLNRIDEGMITTSWGNVNPVSADANAVLFTINFKAVANVTVSEIITLNSRITPAEAYQGATLDVYEVNLEFRTENGVVADAAFELYQNEPNPFDGNTNIGFSLPKAGNATLTVFDVTGKVVHIVRGDFAKGMNTVTLSSNAFNTSGVLYYQLESGEYTATKKMIVLE
jgi:subtilisin-like proprotein convertase family protein